MLNRWSDATSVSPFNQRIRWLGVPIPKPNLLVICPPDHYLLRNLEPIRGAAHISVDNDPSMLERHAPEAEIILWSGMAGNAPPFREIWRHASKVKWIHSIAAGLDDLLLPELIESPVTITNARGVFKRSLAEFVIASMLYFYKHIRRLVETQREHRWDHLSVDWLRGKMMGVVGYGAIGQECAMLAKALGVKIYATRRKPELSAGDAVADRVFPSTELKDMLKEVDVILAAAPLTPQTRHMIGEPEFQVTKSSVIVINVGRGPVIDEAALIRALQQKRVAAAALDVFEHEPLPKNHPFWDMENVLISPHCADRTHDPDWLDLSAQFFVENFRRYVAGQPLLNIVDKKAGY
jgi:phosphoglycerate dehydrogenase-like enzyme